LCRRATSNRIDLEDTFAWKEERTLSQALRLRYDKVIFILEPSEQAKAAIGKRVAVFDYPDGRLSIRYKSLPLRRQGASSGLTTPSISFTRSTKGPSPTTSGWRRYWRMIRDEQRCRGPVGRAGAISATPVSSRSAELLYVPRELTLTR
jgi:hypothetical protein